MERNTFFVKISQAGLLRWEKAARQRLSFVSQANRTPPGYVFFKAKQANLAGTKLEPLQEPLTH